MRKMKINFFFDLLIVFFYLIIMEPLFTGITLHEWIGLGIGLAFIIHILLHWKWVVEATKRLFKKFPKKAKINYILDFLMLIGSFFIILSSFSIAKTIDFSWLGFGVYSYTWFQVHVASSFLVLIVIGIHVGLHWQWTINAFRKIFKINYKIPSIIKYPLIILIIGLGIYSIKYTDLFTTLDRSFSIINPDYTQFTSKGHGGGGGRGGIHSLTATTDSTSILAYLGIIALLTTIVYYLDITINKTLKAIRRRV